MIFSPYWLPPGARLCKLLPDASRIILPDSGHAPLLERGLDIGALLRSHVGACRARLTASVDEAQPGHHLSSRTAGTVNGAAATSEPGAATGEEHSILPGRQLSGGSKLSLAVPARNGLSASGGVNSNGSSSPSSVALQDDQFVRVSGSGNGMGGTVSKSSGAVLDPFDEWAQTLAPWRDLVSPLLLGFEQLPAPGTPAFDRPMLFVGNHQRIGFYDTPLLVYELSIRGYRWVGTISLDLCESVHYVNLYNKLMLSLFVLVPCSLVVADDLLALDKEREFDCS
jgi:hypothetical protein